MPKIIFTTISALIIISNCYAQQQVDSSFYSYKQSQWLSRKIGKWNVTMTLQPTIDVKPIIIKDIQADRSMIGAFCLNETMQPAVGSSMPLFKRISNLDYNLNDARWDYISIDTRITGGIMSFTNFENNGDSIISYILNFPHPGFGSQRVDRGKNVKVKNVIITIDDNHDLVKQYWTLTDGKEWLAVTYDYIRTK